VYVFFTKLTEVCQVVAGTDIQLAVTAFGARQLEVSHQWGWWAEISKGSSFLSWVRFPKMLEHKFRPS